MNGAKHEADFLTSVLIFLSLLVLAAVSQAVCERIDDRRFPAPGRLVDVAARRVHIQQQGAGRPAVILEAGIAASSLNWSLAQAHLAQFTETFSYDRAGFGWSTSQSVGCSLTQVRDELHELIAALKIPSPYIIVAHSFGAYVVTAYAQRFPDELAGVVLVDPLTPEEWIDPAASQRWTLRRGVLFSYIGGLLEFFGIVRFCLWLLDRGRMEASRGVLRLFGGKATETVRRIVGELLKLPPETVRLIRARWSTPKFFWTMGSYIRAVPRCARELHGMRIPSYVPVTVLTGAHQPETRVREHAAIAAHSAHGRQFVASGSAHWIHLDEPELVAEAVKAMIMAQTRAAPEREQ